MGSVAEAPSGKHLDLTESQKILGRIERSVNHLDHFLEVGPYLHNLLLVFQDFQKFEVFETIAP